MPSPCHSSKARIPSRRFIAGSKSSYTPPQCDVVDLGTDQGKTLDTFFSLAENAGLDPTKLAGFQKPRCVSYGPERAPDWQQAVESRGYRFQPANLLMEANLNQLPTADVYLLWHFLSELPSKLAAQRVLLAALTQARTMVWLKLPSFQPDGYNGEGVLRSRGLRFTWTEWSKYPTHWLLQDCQKTLELWRTQEPDRAYVVKIRKAKRVDWTDDPRVIPVTAPRNVVKYHPKYGSKPNPPVRFSQRVVAEWDVIIHFQP